MVSHKHVLVNDKVVNIATFELSEGDKVTLTKYAQELPFVRDSIKSLLRPVPSYLSLDQEKKVGKLIAEKFSADQIPFPLNLDLGLVVEFYSR